MHNLQINAQRLWDSMMEMAQIGGTAKGGVCRLTLTDLDRQVRDWFVRSARKSGCTVTVDEMGNIFARRPGKDNSLPPIAMRQPSRHPADRRQVRRRPGRAGRARGAAHAEGHRATRPSADRGRSTGPTRRARASRPAMLASGRVRRRVHRDYAYSRKDREGKSFGEELDRIGYRGDRAAGDHKWAPSSSCISSRGRSSRTRRR